MSNTKRSSVDKATRPGLGCSLFFSILLLGMVAAAALLTPRLLDFLNNQQTALPAPLPDNTSSAQMLEQRQQALAQLDNYGWMNQAAGVVHIPIAQAISFIAKAGLPVGAPVAAATTATSSQPATGNAVASTATLEPAQIDFKTDILPIFEQHCLDCHGNEDPEKNLQLTSYENVMNGSEDGPVITPGDPQNSYLVELVSKGRMPKRGKKLTTDEVALIAAWVQAGATEKAASPRPPGQVAQISPAQTPITSTAALTPTAAPSSTQPATAALDPATIDFARDVQPIFEQHCLDCHGYEDPEKNLQLTGYESVMNGSEDGPVITPGDPENSYLIEQVVKGRMPKRGKKLTADEIAILTAWVKGGALEKASKPSASSAISQTATISTPQTTAANSTTITATTITATAVTTTATATAVAAMPTIDPATVDFETDVYPIFQDHCTECHGYEDPEKNLQLTSYDNIMAGSEDGPVIKPGDPENSYLVELVTKGRMPKRGKKLTPEQVAIITAWVKGGALEKPAAQAATEKTTQNTPTATEAETATATATPTAPAAPTNTRAATKTATATATMTPQATKTSAATATPTKSATPKAVANQAATNTPTRTPTGTAQPTATSTATKAATATPQPTATKQATTTPTATTASQATVSTTLTTTIPVVDPASVSYSKDVQPIFEQHCLDCHGYEDPEKGLQLTSHSAVLFGSENGPVITPGDPDNSYLIEQVVKGRMPKRGKKLTPEEIAIITAWVKAGAPDN